MHYVDKPPTLTKKTRRPDCQGVNIAREMRVAVGRDLTFQALELGTSLRPSGNGYTIIFGADEMKMTESGDLHEPFPAGLIPYLELFLKAYRPTLLRQGDPKQARPATNRLWIDRYGAPMDEPAMRMSIKTVTKKAFGKAIWPHPFRDCLITSLAIEQPELMRIGSVVLGHASFETAQKHYNQAKMLEAGQKYTGSLTDMRMELISELLISER